MAIEIKKENRDNGTNTQTKVEGKNNEGNLYKKQPVIIIVIKIPLKLMMLIIIQ